MKPICMQVALRKGDSAESFKFSSSCTAAQNFLQLPSGQLELINVTFLVTNDELSCEEFLIGHPVLENINVDTNTLLVENVQYRTVKTALISGTQVHTIAVVR